MCILRSSWILKLNEFQPILSDQPTLSNNWNVWLLLLFYGLQIEHILKWCSKKECCKQCRYVKFKGNSQNVQGVRANNLVVFRNQSVQQIIHVVWCYTLAGHVAQAQRQVFAGLRLKSVRHVLKKGNTCSYFEIILSNMSTVEWQKGLSA